MQQRPGKKRQIQTAKKSQRRAKERIQDPETKDSSIEMVELVVNLGTARCEQMQDDASNLEAKGKKCNGLPN